MHALVVNMVTDPDRAAEVAAHLTNDVTAWAKQQPGFVSGQWLLSENHEAGMGIVVFDSADSATRAAAGPRRFMPDEQRAWNISAVTVYEAVASATR